MVAEVISNRDQQRIAQLLERDMMATLSRNCHDLIVEAAARLRSVCDEHSYRDRLVGEIQQRIHDEFIELSGGRSGRDASVDGARIVEGH